MPWPLTPRHEVVPALDAGSSDRSHRGQRPGHGARHTPCRHSLPDSEIVQPDCLSCLPLPPGGLEATLAPTPTPLCISQTPLPSLQPQLPTSTSALPPCGCEKAGLRGLSQASFPKAPWSWRFADGGRNQVQHMSETCSEL
ncbi:hypothetical protein D623_10014119 [Myotis brandtii]|uniref:Uncharacterized protein n=1 Tax=Myotis brandtii TaxID=109478 RepID=S7PT87_MYOBR|nr:hypothetical protein D623_10014119 [Myotis brandtii]